MTPAQQLIETLALASHPEGGFYREIHRSTSSTAILFLLPAGRRSAFHVVRGSEEIWHFYQGDPLELHLLSPEGHQRLVLDALHRIGVVPPDVWQAAAPQPCEHSAGYTLLGCTVSPPFRFERFALAARGALLDEYPEHAALIERFTPAAPAT
ncbi:MAG: cupin domain-containing protein [Deltaproteobacteria bacterium]|nr:MAG: cupin domain-containing protein [Deltaproteobacteria bacterium]